MTSKLPSVSKNARIIENEDDDPCKVKTSALLYEITERVNQLAQPRIRMSPSYTTDNRANVNKIPKASPRILELSKPKAIYEPPSKLPGFVAPTALRALATERILELSRPKRKPKKMSSRKRKLIYAPCSPRILYLARSKNFSKRGTDDKGISKYRRSERSKLKELDYNISKQRLSKNVPKERKRPRRVRSSNSDRTVITINLDYELKSRRKAKSARERRNALLRCKSSKIKG